MGKVYVYSDNNELAAELIGFAKKHNKETCAITIEQSQAEELKNSGADKVVVLQGSSSLVESYGKAIAQILQEENAELFLVGATFRGRDLAARVAGFLDCAMVSDASEINYVDGKLSTTRIIYGGSVLQTEEVEGLCVVTAPSGKFEAVSGEAEIVTVNADADQRVELVETASIEKHGIDLSTAETVVCVGMAFESKEDMKIAEDLAEVLEAGMACTRGIAEEREWLPAEQYLGISGAVIKPKLYIGMGVSGQVQHIYGVRDAQIIVAINTNDKAPIFKAADYGIVGDMHEVIPALTEALK